MKSFLLLSRDHLHFLIVVPLLIIVTTWPLAPNVLGLGEIDRPPGGGDVLIQFWQAWYGERLLTGKADYFYTDLLFYPNGLSLAFANFGIPQMLVFASLQSFLPAVNAYLLTYMITVFLNALASYILLLRIFGDKWIALAGAVIFCFNPYFFPHIHHLNLTTVYTIPLAIYALHRGITAGRWRWLIAAGAFAGFTAFIAMYILVCLFITMGVYTLCLALTRWRDKRFWIQVALVLIVAASIGLLRLYPMVADANLLNEALQKGGDRLRTTDLMVFLVNPRHPLTPTIFHSLLDRAPPVLPPNGYLGLAPLLLILVGLFRRPNRRLMLPWLLLAAIFAVLRLGHVLTIDGVIYQDTLLPKYYLDNLVPWLTKAFWDTSFFQIGIILPLAMLSCYALQTVLEPAPRRLRAIAILIVIALAAFEYYQPPISLFPRYQASYRWIDWLALEPDQDAIHLINLPMGRNRSKRYLYHQTLHGYPQVEGLASRTPTAAYNYIEANLLLKAWRAGQPINCLPNLMDGFAAAHAQLLADGFTHIILHRSSSADARLAESFVDIPAAYADEHVQIYRLKDLRHTCDATASLSETLAHHRELIERSGAVLPDGITGMLTLYSVDTRSAETADGHIAVLDSDDGSLRLNLEELVSASLSDFDLRLHHGYTHLTAKGALLLAYDLRALDTAEVDPYRAWLSTRLKPCGRIAETETAVLEYFLRPGFPCELMLSQAPLSVHFDNGIQLGNLLASLNEETLNLYLLWEQLPPSAHAFSVQFFDDNGNKAYNQDFVFHRDALGKYEIDLSNLTPGTYSARLIVYNYDAGISLPGLALSSQTRFDRELEFITLTLE